MDNYRKIYTARAKEYHQMITPEDVDGNLLAALQQIAPLENTALLDLGSGTGRIPLLVDEIVSQLIALDLNLPMLLEQKYQRQKVNGFWGLINGDNRELPFPDNFVDIVTVGWAIGHLRGWYERDWMIQIGKILTEMARVTKPGGHLMIMETLTTGALEPAPPSPRLAEYYAWLEETWGYTRRTIQTDYQFKNVDEAVAKTKFFFGPELADKIRKNGWSRLPEWTGVWSKQV
ncbi:MAG: class I SAM-dependent methyltransferase [Chloroflexota bacterium]